MSEESELLATLQSLLASDEKEPREEKKEEESTSPFDMEMILKLGSVFSELNADDDRARLLRDLKPFLSSEKKEHIEQAIKVLKLLKIAEKAKNEKLF